MPQKLNSGNDNMAQGLTKVLVIEGGLSKDLAEARGKAKERFEAQTAEPSGNGIVGARAMGAIMDALEWGKIVAEAYKDVFLERGREFTQGYLEGRKGRIGNLFNKEYRAAQRAMDEMQKPNYS